MGHGKTVHTEESESFEVQFARYLSNTEHQNQKAYIKVMIIPMKVWNSEAAKKKIGDFRQVRDIACCGRLHLAICP